MEMLENSCPAWCRWSLEWSRKMFFHTSSPCFSPRKRPGTRNPLPDDEIQRRVEAIVYRYRKKKKPEDEIDWDFRKVGNYRIKDQKIQDMYKEYLRLYHPELAGDNEVEKGKEENNDKIKRQNVDPEAKERKK